MGEGSRCNQQIKRTDGRIVLLEHRPSLGPFFCRAAIKGQEGDHFHQPLELGPSLLGCARKANAILEFKEHEGRYSDLSKGTSQETFGDQTFALEEVDQAIGIEEIHHRRPRGTS